MLPKIKEEIHKLLKAEFIRPAGYVEWLVNIVPVTKKNGSIRVCIDFCNLNLATPKDEYLMPVLDMLVDVAAKNGMLSFMDGHSGYNLISMAKSDIHKTVFRCPRSIGIYEWEKISFGLSNASATY